jgi:hypothetical protein
LLGLGQVDEASQCYQQALTLRQELGQTNLALEAQAGLTRAALAQGDAPLAAAHADAICKHLAAQRLDGVDEAGRIRLTCYQALRAVGDERAAAVLCEAQRWLREQVERISDDALRESYLHNVAAHRELLTEQTP